jgi:hypothetical protein
VRDLTTRLDASGASWTLDRALGINNAGQIVAGDNAVRSVILTALD